MHSPLWEHIFRARLTPPTHLANALNELKDDFTASKGKELPLALTAFQIVSEANNWLQYSRYSIA
jgi:hypothetical protein